MPRRQVGLALLAAFGAVALGYAVHAGAPSPPGGGTLVLPAMPRVVVFAPHPDDETIAVGGLIARLVQQGAAVHVVFITNGDGWAWAAQQCFATPKPTTLDYLALGALRQREAIAADDELGLAPENLSFLGFPDGGLAELWRSHWSRSNPYVSPYTLEESPPYPGTVDARIDYDGQDLTSMITRVLRDLHPNVIVMPSFYDTHLDHAHAAFFVTEALDALQARDVLPRDVEVLTYLVHSPVWPPPPHGDGDPLPRPRRSQVPDTLWSDIELSPEERSAKQAALAAYHSQLEACPDLERFVRPNELVGRVKSRVLARVAAIH
jgi:LmbE family N-acetylglucosaminyl deacetylase